MLYVEFLIGALVFLGQRVMLTHPARSNYAWLCANVALAVIAYVNNNFGLVGMYLMLSLSNIDLLRTIKSQALRQTVGHV